MRTELDGVLFSVLGFPVTVTIQRSASARGPQTATESRVGGYVGNLRQGSSARRPAAEQVLCSRLATSPVEMCNTPGPSVACQNIGDANDPLSRSCVLSVDHAFGDERASQTILNLVQVDSRNQGSD